MREDERKEDLRSMLRGEERGMLRGGNRTGRERDVRGISGTMREDERRAGKERVEIFLFFK